MAVATYKVSMANNVPILTPNENQIVFVNGDFLIFQQNGTNLNIKVTVVGAGGLPEIGGGHRRSNESETRTTRPPQA